MLRVWQIGSLRASMVQYLCLCVYVCVCVSMLGFEQALETGINSSLHCIDV